ncbi:MAG TPA: serine hydrolase [Candidatus Bathyarchaeia archaeon]|nr:serine hydrolase [Candidatus Bathyarchaeia archaeon]
MGHFYVKALFSLFSLLFLILSVRIVWSALRGLWPKLARQNCLRTESWWRLAFRLALGCTYVLFTSLWLIQVHPVLHIESHPFYDPELHQWHLLDQDGSPEDAAVVKKLDRITRAFFKSHKVQSTPVGICMGAVYKNRTFVFSAGHVAIESDVTPDAGTLFEIGSITKVFTGHALAHCVEQKLVALDDPLSSLLSDWKIPDNQITLKALATHHSGLPNFGELLRHTLKAFLSMKEPGISYSYLTDAESRAYLAGFRSRAISFRYSNFGVGLLGFALARKVNMNYEEMVRQFICEPIGMQDTHVQVAEGGNRTAQGYLGPLRFGPLSLVIRADANACTNVYEGAAGLRSTVKDMLRYIKANIAAPKGPAGNDLTRMQGPIAETTIENSRIGLCLMIKDARYKDPVYWHSGATKGFHSYLAFSKEHAIGVVMLANGCVDDDIAKQVLNALTGFRSHDSVIPSFRQRP